MRRRLSLVKSTLADASANFNGEWPSGKAPVSGTGDRRFDPYLASHEIIIENTSVERGIFGLDLVEETGRPNSLSEAQKGNVILHVLD